MLTSLICRLSIILAILTLAILTPVSKAASALYVESPQDLVSKIEQIDPPTDGVPGELKQATAAYFGASFYQSLISGNLVLASDGKMEDGVVATYGCGSTLSTGFNVESNPKWKALRSQRSSVILLIQRGRPVNISSCPFDRKVFNAQQAEQGGVVAVIIYDPTTFDNIRMVDQGLGPQIRIPSFFINQHYNDRTLTTQNVLAAFVKTLPDSKAWLIEMSLEFYLPNPDGDVELAYWHHVADDDIVPFVTTFGEVARAMPGQLFLEPRPFFFETECDSDLCGSNCLRQSLMSQTYYCSKKQSLPSKFGDVSGADIMRETLRQMCIYNTLVNTKNRSDRNANTLWMWRYWELFYQLDSTSPNPLTPADWKDRSNKRFNIIWQTLHALGMDRNNFPVSAVNQCVDSALAGSYAIYANMLKYWREAGPSGRLSLYINENEYYGTPRCATPITQATCGIVSGICYGFANNTVPDACLKPQNCAFGDSSCGGVTNIDNSVLGVSAGAVVGIVIAFLIVTGVVVWLYLRYYKQRVRADVDVLLQQYLPADTHGSRSSMSQVRQAQEKRLLTELELEDQALETRGL